VTWITLRLRKLRSSTTANAARPLPSQRPESLAVAGATRYDSGQHVEEGAMAWSFKKLLGIVGQTEKPADLPGQAEPHLPGTRWNPPGSPVQLHLIDIDRTYRDKATKGQDGGWRTVPS
jgi:hypothetical protein